MALASFIADWSEDQSRKVGAVIVGDGNVILSTGFNGLPRGISAEFPIRHSRNNGEKYFWFEHAERNAICNAARTGGALNGSKIYTNLFPCADCARAIIQSGIVEVVTEAPPMDEVRYKDSMIRSLQMFEEAQVAVKFYAKVR